MLPLDLTDKKMSTVIFRTALPEDASLWARTRQKAWAATYRGIYPDDWIDNYDYAGKAAKDYDNLNNPDISSYLAMDGDSCIGYFSYGPTEQEEFYLRNLYFLPGYQGMGLGRKVFELLRSDCRKAGYSGFYVHCNYHNHAARGFYEKMGGKFTDFNGFHENKAEDQCRYDYTITADEPEGER